MEKFIIERNEYLKKETQGYFNCIYSGYGTKNNPDFINVLKNTFNSEKKCMLNAAKKAVIERLKLDLPEIIRNENLNECALINVPRAKKEINYTEDQLLFKSAISEVAEYLGITDGTNFIKRVKDTRTTHLKNYNKENNGDLPYPGITKDTCEIKKENIEGKNIILIDDIYTKSVNIDEDCIQALIENGAEKIIFYSIGFTRRNK